MRQRTFQKRALTIVLLIAGALVPYLTFWGCGSGGYDSPTAASSPALLPPETLKSWIDGGKVNSEGYDRVVILDISNAGYGTTGHIPGAQSVNSATELMQTRIEGVAPSVNMVADGSRMDALIQRTGITANTTIVFTSSSLMQATRAYFTFRYWGFPKECLKVLDGVNAAWNATFPGTLDNTTPVIAPSTYSVRDLGVLNAGLRASLGEMMVAAADTDPDTIILDTRTGELAGGYAGTPRSTTGVFAPSGDYTVFEGHLREGRAVGYTTLTGANGRFVPTDNLVTLFAAVGVDSSTTAYVYCRTGVIASLEFFVLDGILGWDTVLYDGSWSQWGAMGDVAKDGVLAAASPWRTDTATYSDLVVYNLDNGATIEQVVLDPLAVQMFTTVSDPSANQIENEDAAYITGGGGTTGGGTTGGGSGGGC